MVIINNPEELKRFVLDIIMEAREEKKLQDERLRLYTRREAAKLMNVSTTHVNSLIARGFLRLDKSGTKVTYESIEEFCNIRKITPVARREIMQFLEKYKK